MRLGNIATGRHFFNRTADLNEITEVLADNHMIIDGPRRLGKSSLLHHLIEHAPAHGFEAQLVDVQGISTAAEFIQEIADAFPSTGQKIKQTLNEFNPFSRIKKVEGKALGVGGSVELEAKEAKHWHVAGDALFERLGEEKHLILIDEFSVFIDKLIARNRDEAKDLLDWLRAWRLNQHVEFRFILTGSIGLHRLLEVHNFNGLVNDCYTFTLGPFKTRHAVEMIQALCDRESLTIDEQTAQHLCTRVGWLSPYYVCLLLQKAMLATKENSSSQITVKHIDSGYESLMAVRSHFSHWETRLKEQLPANEYRLCHKILTEIAAKPSGLSAKQLFARLGGNATDIDQWQALLQKLILRLTEEGYLSAPDSEGKMRFLSFLVLDYWKRHHA